MRAYAIIVGILCAILFGALGAREGFTLATALPFVLSLSAIAYIGLASERGEGPITFDRLTSF